MQIRLRLARLNFPPAHSQSPFFPSPAPTRATTAALPLTFHPQSAENMADNTINGFSRSLEKFRKGISDDQQQEFSSTGLEEVKLAIQQIQDQIGPDKKLRNFTRLKKFFEGMKQMEELVKIFLQVHEVVAFIWVRTWFHSRILFTNLESKGPIKFVMMVGASNIKLNGRLLTLFLDCRHEGRYP